MGCYVIVKEVKNIVAHTKLVEEVAHVGRKSQERGYEGCEEAERGYQS